MVVINDPCIIKLYDTEDDVLDQSEVYSNLLDWAWEGLDLLDDESAKPFAHARIDGELESFGATIILGLDGFIRFPDEEHRMAFLMKWG